MAFSQTLLLFEEKKADCPYFTLTLGFILRKELKLNTNAQNSSFYIKIGLWILTTNFTKTALIIDKKHPNESVWMLCYFMLTSRWIVKCCS